jgi:hypothetical protein
MKLNVKTNCQNGCRIEGYVSNKKYIDRDDNKVSLEFDLLSINKNDKNEVYITPFPIVCYKNRALSVSNWLEDNMLVEVEGRIRITPNGKIIIVATYVRDAYPDFRVATLPDIEDNSNKNINGDNVK